MKKTLLFIFFFFLSISTLSFAQITSATTGDWSGDTTWVGGVVPSSTDDVVIVAGHTVTLNSPVAQMKNLIVQGALQFNKTVIVAMEVNGNIIIEATGSFKVQTRTVTPSLLHTLDLKGDLTHNGTTFDFRSGSAGSTLGVCNMTLSGTINSTITMSTPFSSTNGEFNAITINKTAGAKVIIGSDIYISSGGSAEVPAQSVLTFISGLVETGNYTLIHQSTTSANITGASLTSYVYGNLGRGMSNSAGKSNVFAVGDVTNYRPITIRSTTSGSATGHYVTVGITNGDANTGSSTLSGGIDKVSEVRYYKVTYNKGAGALSMSFDKFSPSYGTDDGVAAGNTNLRVAYSTDARASWNGLSQTVAHTTDLTNPPTTITPDSIATPFVLNDTQSLYVALARLTGTTENTLTGATDVEKEEGIPSSFILEQNFPNPFNPQTNINFSIPNSEKVSMSIYDISGRLVETLIDDVMQQGSYQIQWTPKNIASSIYYCRMITDKFSKSIKLVFLK